MIALIEIGDEPKQEYKFIWGKAPIEKEKVHIYWYEGDIGKEEMRQEVEDLREHYAAVGVMLPVPEHLMEVFYDC